MTRVRIGYADDTRSAIAHLVHTWKRADHEIQIGTIMSSSSGPRDYFKNDVISLFSEPTVDAVALLVLNGKPFLIVLIGGRYRDMTGRPVIAKVVEE